MEFLIQPRTSTQMQVEDAMTEWKEAEAPFIRLQLFVFQSKALIHRNRINFVKISPLRRGMLYLSTNL